MKEKLYLLTETELLNRDSVNFSRGASQNQKPLRLPSPFEIMTHDEIDGYIKELEPYQADFSGHKKIFNSAFKIGAKWALDEIFKRNRQ